MTEFTKTLAAVEALNAFRNARAARIEAAFKESNSGIEPSVDSNGRYHAPCDGYIMPVGMYDNYARDYSDVMFAAGEFLPVMKEDLDPYFPAKEFGGNFSTRVKARVTDIQALIGLELDDVEVSMGAEWGDEEKIAYAYLKGMKSVITGIIADIEYGAVKPSKEEPEVYLEGRKTIIGKVVSTKLVDGFRYGTYDLKMLVKTEEGHKLWGTVPAALDVSECTDLQISLTATFKPGKNGMTYFSRPIAKRSM